jgi:hypothetical protein
MLRARACRQALFAALAQGNPRAIALSFAEACNTIGKLQQLSKTD